MSNPASVLMARAAPPLAPSLTTTVPTINQSERARNAPAHPTNTQTQIGTSSNSLTHGSTFHSRSGHGHAPSSSVLGPAGTAVFHQTSQGLEHDLDSLPLPNLHPTFRPDAENPGDVLVKVQATHFYVHRE